jgi:hypothetical protein
VEEAVLEDVLEEVREAVPVKTGRKAIGSEREKQWISPQL